MELGLSLTLFISGFLVSWLGHCTPFLIASSVVATVGAGMLSTLTPGSRIGMWAGYQVLMSVGAGLGSQNAIMVTQTAVPQKDIPIAVAVVAFASAMANSIFLLVGQSVFQNRLQYHMAIKEPGLDVSTVMIGATLDREKVDAETMPRVLEAYSLAVTESFYVGVAASAVSLCGALLINWHSIRRMFKIGKA